MNPKHSFFLMTLMTLDTNDTDSEIWGMNVMLIVKNG